MDTCVICNTTESLSDSVVAQDLSGKQVILKLCQLHSETTTPKLAKTAYSVRSKIQTLIDEASTAGLKIEIPTVICDGSPLGSMFAASAAAPVVHQVVEAAKLAVVKKPAPAASGKPEVPKAVATAAVNGAAGVPTTVPKTLSDNSSIVISRKSDKLIQSRQKAMVGEGGIVEASYQGGYDMRDCPLCHGSGQVNKSATATVECPKCGGSGIL